MDPVEVVQRWQDCGGHWRVIDRRADSVIVGLFRCDGGEEMDRVQSGDPRFHEFLAGRDCSDD
jgi:hypothetical protein